MSDLTVFRDHARRMAKARHQPDCPSQHPAPIRQRGDQVTVEITPCFGCITDAERALWQRLADEADAYLNRHPEEETLC